MKRGLALVTVCLAVVSTCVAVTVDPVGASGSSCASDVQYQAQVSEPGSQIRFSAVDAEWSADAPLAGMMAHAVAAADVNDDGWIDVFVGSFADRPVDDYRVRGANGPSPDRLLLGGPKGFSVATRFPETRGRTSGAAFADFDGDGRLDLVVARNVREGPRADAPTEVLRNLGDGAFERAATIGEPLGAWSIGIFDYDRDGKIDLFVVEDRWSGGSSALLRNDGDFEFHDVTADAGLPRDVSGLGVTTADLDGDARPDLFVSGANRVFFSDANGHFEEGDSDAFAWETFGPEDDPGGVAAGDLDGDARVDLVIGQHYGSTVDFGKRVPIRVYLNRAGDDGRPRFERLAPSAGIGGLPTRAPHVEIADFDNDGRVDILVGVAIDATTPLVYRNVGERDGALSFESTGEVTSEQYWAAGTVADLDRDGRLDVVLADFDVGRPTLVLRNVGDVGHWTAVGAPSGSIVRLTTGSGTRLREVSVASSSGFGSSPPPVAWFGLGRERSARATVELPAGAKKSVEVRRDALTQLDC